MERVVASNLDLHYHVMATFGFDVTTEIEHWLYLYFKMNVDKPITMCAISMASKP